MSNDHIVHYGVPGMKWGVRKDRRWDKKAFSKKTYVKVYNNTAKRVNGELPKLNAKYKGKNLKDKKIWDSYISEHKRIFEKIANQELSRQLGGTTNPSGSKKVKAVMNSETGYMAIVPSDYKMKHSDSEEFDFESVRFKLHFNDLGFVTKVTVESPKEIKHYGIKGQKWGVRRDRKKAASLSKKSDANAKYSKNVKELADEYRTAANERPSGGGKIRSTLRKNATKSDLKEAGKWDKYSKELSDKSKSQKAKSKKLEERANSKEKAIESKKKAQAVLKDPATKLSDKELNARVKRLQMEENYSRLVNNKNSRNATTLQRGQAMALEILTNAAKTNIQNYANKAMGDAINLGAELAKKK